MLVVDGYRIRIRGLVMDKDEEVVKNGSLEGGGAGAEWRIVRTLEVRDSEEARKINDHGSVTPARHLP